MVSRDEKELNYVLKSGSLKEIKHVFGKFTEPLKSNEVTKVLRLLLGRSNFDFEMVKLLKSKQCDLNAPLGDTKTNPEQYRMGDYLATYGRLSPRLIYEMAKAGYDFSKTNKNNEHVGFYLIASKAINYQVVAALKAQGVDFSTKNSEGKTAGDLMYYHVEELGKKMFLKTPTEASIKKLSPLFLTQSDLINLVSYQGDDLKKFINQRLNEIKPKENKHIGIQKILQDNDTLINIAYHVRQSEREYQKCISSASETFVANCTPLALQKMKSAKEQERE